MAFKAKIAELMVSLGIDSASYKTGLNAAKKDANNWSDSVKQYSANARTAINNAGKVASAAAAAAVAATAVIVKEQLQQIDQMTKFADSIGIGTVALAGLYHQAELNGVAQAQLDKGLKDMTRRVAEAAEGTGEATGALDKLGLSAEKLKKLAPDQQFSQIADAMKDVKNQNDRVLLAYDLFGSKGVGIANMMRDGAAGLAAAQDEALGLGIAINRIDAAKIEAANDATYRAKMVMDGLGKSITIAVAPVITEIANEFFNAGKASDGFRDQVVQGMSIAVDAVGIVGNAIRSVQIIWKGAQVLIAEGLNLTVQLFKKVADMLPEISKSTPIIGKYADQVNGFKNSINLMADVSVDRVAELKKELDALLLEDLPRDKFNELFQGVIDKSQEMAEKVAESQAKINESVSGSGSTINPADYDSINATQAALRTKMEAEKEAYDKRQEIIENAYRDKLITEEKYNQLSARNSKFWADFENKEKEQIIKDQIEGHAMFFANMATLSEHGNKNLARIGKAAAAVNITISTIQAAMSAYKAGVEIHPAIGVAWAASAVVAGMMRLRQLQSVGTGSSASLSGGGLSGQTTFDQNLPSANSSMPDTAAGITSFNRDTQEGLLASSKSGTTINLIEDASRAGQVETLTEEDVINIYTSNIQRQGDIAKTQEQTYGLTRYGT